MIFGILGLNELSVIERCPYYRGVRKERLDCSTSTFMLNTLRFKYNLLCQSYMFGIFLYSKYWSQRTQFLGCTSECALVKEGMVQPSKLKFFLGHHLATNSFGSGRLFYKSSRQLQNLRPHGDQNGCNLEGCMVAWWFILVYLAPDQEVKMNSFGRTFAQNYYHVFLRILPNRFGTFFVNFLFGHSQ